MPVRPDDPAHRIGQLTADGLTPYQIGRRLNAEQVPTRTGKVGAWSYALVRQYQNPGAHTAYQRAWRRQRAG